MIGPDGKPDGLIDSQVPLRVPRVDDPSKQEATDLDLVSSGADSFVPDASAVAVVLPDKAQDGAAVGPVTVTPEGSADAMRVDGDTIAYPNIEKDTDLVINPTANGIETFHQLRSADSPESVKLDLRLPAGAKLQKTDQGTVEVISNGKAKMTISAPVATDAQGQVLPSSLDIHGDSLSITTKHRDRSVAYPILVDPLYSAEDDWACAYRGRPLCSDTWFHGYGYNSPSDQGPVLAGLGAWSGSVTNSSLGASYRCLRVDAAYFNDCYNNAPNWAQGSDGWSVGNTGLHVWAYPTSYSAGATAQYLYDPPGTTTKITRADFGAQFLRRGPSPGWMVGFNGIWSPNQGYLPGALKYLIGNEDGSNDTSLTHYWNALFGSSGAPNQYAVFGLTHLSPSGVGNWVNAYMGAAIMKLEDPEAPAPLQNTAPTGVDGWAKAGDTYTFSPKASDPGLGVKNIGLFMPPGSTGPNQNRAAYCNGGATGPCAVAQPVGFSLQAGTPRMGYDLYPVSWGTVTAPPFDVPADTLPEGRSTITLRAEDVMGGPGHQTDTQIPVKVDRTAPALTVTGDLRAAEGKWVADGTYDVNVAGTDSASGVASVRLEIDGDPVGGPVANPDSRDGAPLTKAYRVDTTPIKYGQHKLTVTVTDRVGHSTSNSWSILADGHQSEFTFDTPLTVQEAKSVASSGDGLLTMRNETDSDEAGGFVVNGGTAAQAVDDFAEAYSAQHDGHSPSIETMVFASSVPTSAMGSLASRVSSRNEVDLTQARRMVDGASESDDAPALYPDDLSQEDRSAEENGDTRPEEDDSASTSAGVERWAPLYGGTYTYETSGKRSRTILQTLMWNRQSDLELFQREDLDDAYEHDFKLINTNNHSNLKNPVCGGENDNFWAVRDGKVWSVKGANARAAKPYFDTDLADDCTQEDFTIGFIYPRNLKGRKKYELLVTTKAGKNARSDYALTAQKLRRQCSSATPKCVGLTERGSSQRLIGNTKGSAPECRRWRKGKQSRKC